MKIYVESKNKVYDVKLIDFVNKKVTFEDNKKNEIEDLEQVEILSYTGLFDKNHNEIFVGCILKKEEEKFVVKKENGYYVLQEYGNYNIIKNGTLEKEYGETYLLPIWEQNTEQMEIVGNYWENSFLLKE